MDPIRGTNVSLDVALSALKASEIKNELEFAQVRLALDTQKTEGRAIVEMLENLGKSIDTYV